MLVGNLCFIVPNQSGLQLALTVKTRNNKSGCVKFVYLTVLMHYVVFSEIVVLSLTSDNFMFP
jgi:hypothetical protein